MKPAEAPASFEQLVSSICNIHGALCAQASKAVNISLTLRNWLIGAYITEYELNGMDRAGYGEELLSRLAKKLSGLNVSACSTRQLYNYANFYKTYPGIVRSLTAQFQCLVPEEVMQRA
ncbi:MAG: DUF1016 N-terminal domain-containing protein, partial [Pontiellaceae bacterium]|nr:DUF1016 N-terminal domain-containing protein [Pontiellaceae bacterium]